MSFGKSAADYLRDVQERLPVAEQHDTEQKLYQKYNCDPPTNILKLGNMYWSPVKVIAKRSPYSYEVELNGVKKHYHATTYAHIEPVLYDQSVCDVVK